MKSLILKAIGLINQLLYPKYPIKTLPHSPIVIAKCGFFQRIIGINRNVAWPVHRSSQFLAPEKVIPGTRTPGLAHNCFIDARNGVEFGTNVWMAHGVNIISQNHDNNSFHKYVSSKPIKIGNNCLLGANSTLLPGVELGNHTIVAAGAVVTKSFLEENQILVGNPARIGKRIGAYKCAE